MILAENKMAGRTTIYAKYMASGCLFMHRRLWFEILPRGFVMQRQILINVMISFAYALNLPLNTQRPHHRSQRAGKLGLDFGSWQSPDISRSHLYRGTFPWTPPTAIYRAYTVSIIRGKRVLFFHKEGLQLPVPSQCQNSQKN